MSLRRSIRTYAMVVGQKSATYLPECLYSAAAVWDFSFLLCLLCIWFDCDARSWRFITFLQCRLYRANIFVGITSIRTNGESVWKIKWLKLIFSVGFDRQCRIRHTHKHTNGREKKEKRKAHQTKLTKMRLSTCVQHLERDRWICEAYDSWSLLTTGYLKKIIVR